jgi:hypothetical protein
MSSKNLGSLIEIFVSLDEFVHKNLFYEKETHPPSLNATKKSEEIISLLLNRSTFTR